MTNPPPRDPNSTLWIETNQRYLLAEVAKVRQVLEQKVSHITPDTLSADPDLKTATPDSDHWSLMAPPCLKTLCWQFGLSDFERQILLLCAGAELSRAFSPLFAALHGNPQQNYPTFGLAFSLFPEVAWEALTPQTPLRRWRMIEVFPGAELTHSPLRIDEHILHRLMGLPELDSRLQGIVQPISIAEEIPLPTSHQDVAEHIALTGLSTDSGSPVIQLVGHDGATTRAIALVAAQHQKLSLHLIQAEALPPDPESLKLLQCLWERESILDQSTLLLDCSHLPAEPRPLKATIAGVIDNSQRPLILASCDRIPPQRRPLHTIELSPPTPQEQYQLWQTHLGATATQLNGHIDQLVTYFNLTAPAIQTVCNQVKGMSNNLKSKIQNPKFDVSDLLWQTCRSQAKPVLGELAQPISSAATWDDLVLPEAEFQVLKTIAAHVRQRSMVYHQWGFAQRGGRGLGISALFAGASGTGKTLAAETLANELNLDLYKIDLSMVVSKYIGETEKNLRRIFDGAEKGGAILLFDEADALFGKRSEVKDARDRYANMEVAYLLQRIEAYRGLAILTTNLKASIDQAFLRRIRFVVQFPFPDAAQREMIWRCSFPKQMPFGELNFRTLAKLNLAGGNIRNIALNAAFLAADAGESVSMAHILQAAQSEYIKLERPLTELRAKDLANHL